MAAAALARPTNLAAGGLASPRGAATGPSIPIPPSAPAPPASTPAPDISPPNFLRA